ncbi:hypothetical protein XENOCAPTIV_007298 [Xenoophorus captivus]|uniref:Uncharacterized protein n=1 Tax=Xenoophorus captivus TaxID=1517983 RepID=A0ABV0QHV4_9TELE
MLLTVNSYVIFLLPTPKATLNLLCIPQPPINVQINAEPVGDAELEGHRSKLSQLIETLRHFKTELCFFLQIKKRPIHYCPMAFAAFSVQNIRNSQPKEFRNQCM